FPHLKWWSMRRIQTFRRQPYRCGHWSEDGQHVCGGRRGKDVASLRAEQRLAAGGRRLPRPGSSHVYISGTFFARPGARRVGSIPTEDDAAPIVEAPRQAEAEEVFVLISFEGPD